MTNKQWMLLTAVLAFAIALCVPVTEARIVRIEINRIESPTFEGRSFGDVGQY